MNSIIFCGRLASLRLSGFYSAPSKCFQYHGILRYPRICSKRLLENPVYSANFSLCHAARFEFRSFKRWKQISSEQEKKSENISKEAEESPPEKLSLFKRYHKMLKEYWYVLLPVHFITSPIWFGGFYYAAQCYTSWSWMLPHSGIDIVPFLEYINLPEQFIEPLRSSSLGYVAVATAIYKLATPARYMVTLGGTTFAIKFLTKRGLIRPAPTKAEIKTIIQNKLKKDTNEKQP